MRCGGVAGNDLYPGQMVGGISLRSLLERGLWLPFLLRLGVEPIKIVNFIERKWRTSFWNLGE